MKAQNPKYSSVCVQRQANMGQGGCSGKIKSYLRKNMLINTQSALIIVLMMISNSEIMF